MIDDFSIKMILMILGSLVGAIVQYVAIRIQYNGQWEYLSTGKKRAMSLVGGISAFIVGNWLLANRDLSLTPSEIVNELFLYQTLAGWGGGAVIDLLFKYVFNTKKDMNIPPDVFSSQIREVIDDELASDSDSNH